MAVRFPRALVPGDVIGVTASSSGIPDELRPRLDFAASVVRGRGYEIEFGECLDGRTHVSAPAPERAAELMRMLTDPAIAAVIPPWGGETAIDLLPLLDFDAIARAEPTWLIGYSDISTLLTPLTLLGGVATLHGNNLMDTPYDVPHPLLSWLDIVALAPGSSFTQSSPGVHRADGHDDWKSDPATTRHIWNGEGSWVRFDDGRGPVDVSGRMIGGCIETLSNLAGTKYGDTSRLAQLGDGMIVYVEAAEDGALEICRNLHGMRLAGFFDGAAAVLVGRTGAPDSPTLTQKDAVLDAIGQLGIPIVADVECGHVPPHLPIVNGAIGRLVLTDDDAFLTQTLA